MIPKFWIELCQFNGNIIKLRLFEQKGAGVMYTSAHTQHILQMTLKAKTYLYFLKFVTSHVHI